MKKFIICTVILTALTLVSCNSTKPKASDTTTDTTTVVTDTIVVE